ncbi:unnamed protein product [Acanthosepion pharaonis]|uniref:Peptidase A2 domain-containing protein n=1 Tax=Acanthosepion pharaonis TaxID=158019 RepID=A0A812C4F1_ACAPH|nr:unnamed protein product [Sepia pharaonis]
MATDEWEQNTLINVAMPLTNLPPYNEQNTKNWFLQLEAIFSVRKITSQQAKFVNVVQVLPPSVVDEVADILEHVPEQEPYTRLKEAILKRTGRSDEELLRELFTHVTRGDRTPSQLLRFMRSRLGKHSMAESILRELWMDKLPTTITQILAPIADNTPLDQLANSADRIATKLDQGVCAVQRPDDTSAKETDLEKAVADLQHQLQDIRMLLSRTSRGPMPATGDSAPGQRIARHPANTAPKPSRKTKQPAGRSGRTPGKNIRSRLFYVWDRRNNIKFLVDTGAAISVIPPKEQQDRKATPYKLQAANGSTIETYGAKTLTLNIGMRRDFTWTFTQADVKTPILGADFLAHYDLAVHMNTRTLSDNTTNIAVKGTLSRHNTTGISVTTCHGREYIEILNRYSDLIQPLAGTGPARHQTQHHIKTSGQPTFSHPRRLPPHKLEYAQKEFNNMLQDGFIRPSDSPYASPLHLQQLEPAAVQSSSSSSSAAARASRAVRPPPHHQQQPAAASSSEPAEQSSFIVSSSDADISSSLSSDYQAAILRDTPPKDELTTPQHCPRRSSLSASTDIQGSTGPRTSLVPFGLPPSCRLET